MVGEVGFFATNGADVNRRFARVSNDICRYDEGFTTVGSKRCFVANFLQ
jgi:hypothetical protein